jgi:hypothetical protein
MKTAFSFLESSEISTLTLLYNILYIRHIRTNSGKSQGKRY